MAQSPESTPLLTQTPQQRSQAESKVMTLLNSQANKQEGGSRTDEYIAFRAHKTEPLWLVAGSAC